ncbi:MAG: hypothetical protein U0667_08325 [Chloroflexota bacterium]
MDIDQLAPGPYPDPGARLAMSPGQARFVSWMADVLVYVTVINLFVEFAPGVIIESFSVSLLTAILLKLMLDATLGLKRRVASWFAGREGVVWKALLVASIWAILFVSKFVIIEVTALVFGDRVALGGFFGIVVLILAMMGARQLLGWVYGRLAD